MAKTILIFAKHATPWIKISVRGERFAEERFKKIVEQLGNEKAQVVIEDMFVGQSSKYHESDIRTNTRLCAELRQETKQYLAELKAIAKSLEEGKNELEGKYSIPLGRAIASMNRINRGRICLHLSEFDNECQYLTLEVAVSRNAAYLTAYRDGRINEAIDQLIKSLNQTVEVVQRRDTLLQEQIRQLHRKTGNTVIVRIGSNHRYLARSLAKDLGGSTVESYAQSDEPFSYYDEMLIKLLEGEDIDLERLYRNLYKELYFNLEFMNILSRGGCIDRDVEDILAGLRQKFDRKM